MRESTSISQADAHQSNLRPYPFSITVFFPAWNEARTLPQVIERTFDLLSDRFDEFEVLVINDGSTDSTGDVLKELKDQYGERLRIFTHPENRGFGPALVSGFRWATKDLVFYTGADGQYDIGELPKLLDVLRPDVGLVNGYRLQPQGRWTRRWLGMFYNFFARTVFRIPLKDMDCEYRLLQRSLVQDLDLTTTTGAICLEMVKHVQGRKAAMLEIPVSHQARQEGTAGFFRAQSFPTMLAQILSIYLKFVLRPLWDRFGQRSEFGDPSRTNSN